MTTASIVNSTPRSICIQFKPDWREVSLGTHQALPESSDELAQSLPCRASRYVPL
jgi:hypothetical protein